MVAQAGVFFFGALAIILVARKNKWGFFFGLLSQPFWFATAFINHQWGVFLVSIAYSISWIYGLYNWFWKKETNKNKQNE